MHGCYVAQQPFVDSTGSKELETRVMSKVHVVEVLMRQQFQYHGRAVKDAALAVITVPDAATCPVISDNTPNIRSHAGHYLVHHVARGKAREASVSQQTVMVVRSANTERAYNTFSIHTGIGVECKREFQRDTTPNAVRAIDRAAEQGVGSQRTGVNILVIVVLAVLVAIDGIGKAGIMCPIARTLKPTRLLAERQVVGFRTAQHTAHAPTEANGIGADDTVLPALVRKGYHARCIGTFVKIKRAEIDPRAPAYLLIDGEMGCYALVDYRVVSIGDAGRTGGVGNIDGIAPRSRDAGHPESSSSGLSSSAHRLHITGCATDEGIIVVFQRSIWCKESLGAVAPVHISAMLLHIKALFGVVWVVVHNDFMGLIVPFARGEYHSTGILQHGY